MKISNKICCVFILTLVFIAVCVEARTTSKKSKADGKKHSAKQSKNFRSGLINTWPWGQHSDCDHMNTFDTEYQDEDHDGDFELNSWPRCGINLYSELFSDSKLQSKFRSIQHYLAELEQTIDKMQNFGHKDFNERNVNKDSVSKGQYPDLVAIGTYDGGPFCSGTIIADSWVVTAAHCFAETIDKPCKYNVRAGSVNWMVDLDDHVQDRRLVGIYRHPDYDNHTHVNDIALLKLESPLKLDPDSYINAACIPETGRSVSVGFECVTAGWGTQVDGDPNSAAVEAMQTVLPVVGYEGDKCGENDALPPGMLCAGFTDEDESTDACQVDTDGPLVCWDDDRAKMSVLGVISFGKGYSWQAYPGISRYTDVGQYRRWIASVMRRHA